MKYMMLRGAGMALWASPDACILVEQLASRRQHRGTESDALRRGYGTLSWPSYMHIGEAVGNFETAHRYRDGMQSRNAQHDTL